MGTDRREVRVVPGDAAGDGVFHVLDLANAVPFARIPDQDGIDADVPNLKPDLIYFLRKTTERIMENVDELDIARILRSRSRVVSRRRDRRREKVHAGRRKLVRTNDGQTGRVHFYFRAGSPDGATDHIPNDEPIYEL